MYLWSDFGWSVSLPIWGTRALVDIKAELIHLRHIVLTNLRTGKQGPFIPNYSGWVAKEYSHSYEAFTGFRFEPRTCAKVAAQAIIWSAREGGIESTSSCDILPSKGWFLLSPDIAVARLSVLKLRLPYCEMCMFLWYCCTTPEKVCTRHRCEVSTPIRIRSDTLILLCHQTVVSRNTSNSGHNGFQSSFPMNKTICVGL